MDADDISEPHRFQRQLELLSRIPAAAACSNNCFYIDATGLTIGSSTVPLRPARIRWELRRGLRGMVQGSALFRTSALAAVEGYRTQFRLAEEVDLFLRLADRFDLVNAAEFLYRIRLHDQSFAVANIEQNTRYVLYALDCARRRRSHLSERSFEAFSASMNIPTRIRLSREIAAVALWRTSRSRYRWPLIALSALLDPKRPLARLLRYAERRLGR
jgi:hypothetical protein